MNWLGGMGWCLGWCLDRLPERLRYWVVWQLIRTVSCSPTMRRKLIAMPHLMIGARERAAESILHRLRLQRPLLPWPAAEHLRALELKNGRLGGVLLGAHLSTNRHVLRNLKAQGIDVAIVSLFDGASQSVPGVRQIMPSKQMYFAIRQQVRKGAWVLLTLDQFKPFPGAHKMLIAPELKRRFPQSLFLQTTAIPALIQMQLPLLLMFPHLSQTGLEVEISELSRDPETAFCQYVDALNRVLRAVHELHADRADA